MSGDVGQFYGRGLSQWPTAPAEPYCDHGPMDACRCLALPVWKLPDPIPAAADPLERLSGIRIHKAVPAGEQAVAIVQGDAGQVLGYVLQSEVDRIRGLPDAETIRRRAAEIQELMIGTPPPPPAPGVDAEDMHVYAHEFDPIGGFVCAECGTPTESEPCPEHQPNAYARMTQ